jgi:hypothetical protein
MFKKSMVLFALFVLAGCTVPPAGTDTETPVPPTFTKRPTLPAVTQTPAPGPTVDPGDAPYLPNPAWQPGANNPDVNPDNIQITICVSGYSSKIRPPVSYTNALKLKQIKQYGYSDTNLANYEEDHLISLALGGDPKDPRNLWPQPRYTKPYNASTKDTLEDVLHKMVCSGQVPLDTARQEMATDWLAAYRKYVDQSLIDVTPVATEP